MRGRESERQFHARRQLHARGHAGHFVLAVGFDLAHCVVDRGGTLIAAANLVRRMGARIFEAAAIIDLPELGGSQRLQDMGIPTFCLTQFALTDK